MRSRGTGVAGNYSEDLECALRAGAGAHVCSVQMLSQRLNKMLKQGDKRSVFNNIFAKG